MVCKNGTPQMNGERRNERMNEWRTKQRMNGGSEFVLCLCSCRHPHANRRAVAKERSAGVTLSTFDSMRRYAGSISILDSSMRAGEYQDCARKYAAACMRCSLAKRWGDTDILYLGDARWVHLEVGRGSEIVTCQRKPCTCTLALSTTS